MKDKIKQKLDEYLEFDSDELFPYRVKSNDNLVFGGAIRDIISDMPIHDIDIISGPSSSKRLGDLLLSKGYLYLDGLTPKDLSSVYTDIHIISEPKNYVKGSKIVQVIVPRGEMKNSEDCKKLIEDLVTEVDISCCGVSYDGSNLIENVKDSIIHCLNKVYVVNDVAKMRTNRLTHRKVKMENRGWMEISGLSGLRNERIDHLLNGNDDFECVMKWK